MYLNNQYLRLSSKSDQIKSNNLLPFNVLELVSKEQTLNMLSANKLQAAILTESLVAQDLFEKHPQ